MDGCIGSSSSIHVCHDLKELFIREVFIDWKGVLSFPISMEPRQVIGYYVFDPFCLEFQYGTLATRETIG